MQGTLTEAIPLDQGDAVVFAGQPMAAILGYLCDPVAVRKTSSKTDEKLGNWRIKPILAHGSIWHVAKYTCDEWCKDLLTW